MVNVTWTERMYAYELRWVDIPNSDIEQLLRENPDYDEDDVRNWIRDNMWDYEYQYGDVDYGDDSETMDMTIDEDGELDSIIENFVENHKELYKDEEDEEETDNTLIGVLGYDED